MASVIYKNDAHGNDEMPAERNHNFTLPEKGRELPAKLSKILTKKLQKKSNKQTKATHLKRVKDYYKIQTTGSQLEVNKTATKDQISDPRAVLDTNSSTLQGMKEPKLPQVLYLWRKEQRSA